MAQYTTKRKYTKKPSTQIKKIVKTVKKEIVKPVSEVTSKTSLPATKSFWQKVIEWSKRLMR